MFNGPFCDNEGLVCGAVSVEYDARASSVMFVWVMCACRVEWTRVEDGVEPLGSLRCGVFAGSSSVVLRAGVYAYTELEVRVTGPCV